MISLAWFLRQQHHRTKDVSQFCARSQGSHGSVPGQSIWYWQPGFPAPCAGGGLSAWHEGCCLSGHGEPLTLCIHIVVWTLERDAEQDYDITVGFFCSTGCFQHHRDGPCFEPLPVFRRFTSHYQVCSTLCWQWPPCHNDWLHVAHNLPAVSWSCIHKGPKRHHWRVPHGFVQVSLIIANLWCNLILPGS